MRIAASILGLILGGCALVGCAAVGPIPVAQMENDCELSCRNVYDHCSDDSAKERQPHATTCSQDLHDCLGKCAAAIASDPAGRAEIAARREDPGILVRAIAEIFVAASRR